MFKAVAGRGKDLDDVMALLALYPKLDLSRIRARVRELAALADAPNMPAGLETAIAAYRKAIRSAPKKNVRSRPAPTKKRPPRR